MKTKTKNIIISCLIILFVQSVSLYSQEIQKDIKDYTREEILNIPYDKLVEMPLEDLLILADIVGVSLDELYEMILNKDVVSASKKVESSFEAPLSTSVVSYDEIVASGARTIEEALRLVPGLIVREKTNGNFDVHIRGNDNVPGRHMFVYSENSISLVMIDGRQVYNYIHGGTFWETLPIGIEDIDRIEVVRGPSSALYGPNAVSGVVNIITKEAESKKLKIFGDAQVGNLSTMIANVGIEKKISNKFGFRLSGNIQGMSRNSDLLYVYKAGQYGYSITKEMLDTLREYSSQENRFYNVFDPADGIDLMYPDPKRSRDVMGVNGMLNYNMNKNIGFDLTMGYQNSEVLSTTMGDNPTPFAGRKSATQYLDFRSKINNLKIQTNFMNGWQDIVREDTGFKVDIMNFNAIAEYDVLIGKKITITPGVTYQLASYDDLNYLSYVGQGFLNRKRELQSTALSLRTEYKPLENLRLIAALRGEKYNTHDDFYYSYQLIGSYSINNQHNIRSVYSRANRGPFLVDAYADYVWVRQERPIPGVIHFKGQDNLDLLTMDMIEFGYRIKPVNNIQADFEFFQTKTKNFGALYPDSASLVTLNYSQPNIIPNRPFVSMRYTNLDLSTVQSGITGNITWVVNKSFIVKFFGTYQITKIYDAIPDIQDKTVQDMIVKAFVNHNLDSTIFYSKNFTDERIAEEKHKWTPSFIGGLTLDFKLLKDKARINLNNYSYSKEVFNNKYGEYTIDPKFIVNVKISYKIFKENYLYFNIRNILGDMQEFPYMDQIGTNYLIGLHLDF